MDATLSYLTTDDALLEFSKLMGIVYLEDKFTTQRLTLIAEPFSFHSIQGKQFIVTINTISRHHKSIQELTDLPLLLGRPIEQIFARIAFPQLPELVYWIFGGIDNILEGSIFDTR